jgi:hypothetical protein
MSGSRSSLNGSHSNGRSTSSSSSSSSRSRSNDHGGNGGNGSNEHTGGGSYSYGGYRRNNSEPSGSRESSSSSSSINSSSNNGSSGRHRHANWEKDQAVKAAKKGNSTSTDAHARPDNNGVRSGSKTVVSDKPFPQRDRCSVCFQSSSSSPSDGGQCLHLHGHPHRRRVVNVALDDE